MARVIFSPTTTPMLPPMNEYSIAAISVSMPSMVPVPQMIASLRPLVCCALRSRCEYGLVSMKFSGSVDASSRSCSTHGPSKSIARRSAAPNRKWCEHFGQTCMLPSRSFL